MCVKFNIPVCGVSSFMVSWTRQQGVGVGTCVRRIYRIQKPIWITESINIKIAIYVYDYCKINVK